MEDQHSRFLAARVLRRVALAHTVQLQPPESLCKQGKCSQLVKHNPGSPLSRTFELGSVGCVNRPSQVIIHPLQHPEKHTKVERLANSNNERSGDIFLCFRIFIDRLPLISTRNTSLQ